MTRSLNVGERLITRLRLFLPSVKCLMIDTSHQETVNHTAASCPQTGSQTAPYHSWFLQCFMLFPACNCHRHSFDCYYDPEVDQRRASLDVHGHYRGGGVCLNCQVTSTFQPQNGFRLLLFYSGRLKHLKRHRNLTKTWL